MASWDVDGLQHNLSLSKAVLIARITGGPLLVMTDKVLNVTSKCD